jgi:DNA polymerase-1
MTRIAIDTETTGVAWDDQAFMISLAYRKDNDPDNPILSFVYDKREMSETDWYTLTGEVAALLSNADSIIMHNAKFDIQKLLLLGFNKDLFTDIDKWEDTQAIAHLIDEQESSALKSLAARILREQTDENEVLRAYRRKNKLKKEDGYEKIPNEVLAPYAAKDAEYTLRLYETLMRRLDNYELYKMEKELTLALLDIEAAGLAINREYVGDMRRSYGDKIFQTKKRIADLAGSDFNPQSPQQILAVFAERGISLDKTDKKTLESVDDELASLIVELREANKIKTTYFDALFEESRDGILHPNFRQHGTRTGRMSSGAAEA